MPARMAPPAHIIDVLSRRPDLSTFLVHLTRSNGASSAGANLDSILRSRTIEARTPMGWCANAVASVPSAAYSQRVVCMSETPLSEIHTLFANISGRRVHLEPFGVVFTKVTARRMGVNPVWYVDKTPGHDWSIGKALDELADAATLAPQVFAQHPLAHIAPFVEAMGTWANGRREFWWEREWRHLGDLDFAYRDLALVLCPADEIDYFEGLARPGMFRAVDPRWSLEQMIAHLAGIDPSTVSPFVGRRPAS